MITIFTSLNPVDADLVRARLAAADFHPFIIRDVAATGGLVLASEGTAVQVPEDEEEAVREFLDSSEAPPA